MDKDQKRIETEDDWPETVTVNDEDRVWDEKLGHHRCPLGLIQATRPILDCWEWDSKGGLKLYVQQLEREGICDVAVVHEDDEAVTLRVVVCSYEHLRAKYPNLITEAHKWYGLKPLNGRRLFDAETGGEIWVHRIADAAPATGFDANQHTVDDLDIPF
jgi:hypothetical protein